MLFTSVVASVKENAGVLFALVITAFMLAFALALSAPPTPLAFALALALALTIITISLCTNTRDIHVPATTSTTPTTPCWLCQCHLGHDCFNILLSSIKIHLVGGVIKYEGLGGLKNGVSDPSEKVLNLLCLRDRVTKHLKFVIHILKACNELIKRKPDIAMELVVVNDDICLVLACHLSGRLFTCYFVSKIPPDYPAFY